MKKIISLTLIFIMALSSLTCYAEAGDVYSYECDLSGANAINQFTVNVPSGTGYAEAVYDSGDYALKLTSTASSKTEIYADTVLPQALTIQDNKYYVFSVDVKTSTSGFAFIFNVNGEGTYNNKNPWLGIIRISGGKFTVFNPNLQVIKEIAAAGEKHSISVVYKGKNFDSIYINNEKYTSNHFPVLPSDFSKTGFLQVTWEQVSSNFSNISIKEISPLSLESAPEFENVSVYPGKVDLSFNNPLESITSASFSDKNGTVIPASTSISGNTLSLIPQKALIPNEEYAVTITGLKDRYEYTYSSDTISLKTVTKEPLYIEEEFVTSDGVSRFSADNGSLNYTDGAISHSIDFGLSSQIDFTGDVFSHDITEGRYTREITYNAGSSDGKIEFFKFDPSEGACLVEAYVKSGEEGLWLRGYDGTDLNTKLPADTVFDLAIVYDASEGGYDVYYNRSKINTDKIIVSANDFKNAHSFKRTAGASAVIDILDNVRYYKISDNSAMKLLSSSVSDGDTVKCYNDKLEFDFSQDIVSSSLSSVVLKAKDGTNVDIDTAIDSSDAKKLVININEILLANTDYVLDISGIKGDSSLYKEGLISFKTSNNINVTKPTFSGTAIDASGNLQSGTLNVSVNVNSNTYTGDTDSAALIVVVYKGYKITGISSDSVSDLTASDTELTADVTVGSDLTDVYVKVFVVDSLSGMSPVSKTVTLN